ncbi:MAG TPA: FAD-binding oxidoreductase [Acidimicrobiia bacterium]|nr:FAD-binding oxidoreductase [Acidimicrobiia bacterium]
MSIPSKAKYVVIGAGIHGLSTAWHLAQELEARGLGSGQDVVVIDKSGIGAGPSGIACGVIRNNYFQPAMRRLMAHSVAVWESDPDSFNYHAVGYIQAGPEAMHADVVSIFEQQQQIGYSSVLVEGEGECRSYMQGIFSDWQAQGISVILHEKQGGYANNMSSIKGLAMKAENLGVRILAPVTVTGFKRASGRVTAVETNEGDIACEWVVLGAGPWVRDFWAMLDLPSTITVKGRDGSLYQRPMWTYWFLQEGVLRVDPNYLTDNQGGMPPVIHVDTDAPLYGPAGELITDQLWGIYYKPDFNFGGIQGGAMPFVVDKPASEVNVDPYGPESPEYNVDERFERMWTSALAHCHQRFVGKQDLYHRTRSGGLGAFTPDSFPVFDTMLDNVYVIADSNHGYKMIGVGALVAREILGGREEILEPFRFTRYAEGNLHPVSNSPYPWS